MIAALELLAAEARGFLAAGFIVFLRVGAAMAVLPAFGEQTVPGRVRLVLALAFAQEFLSLTFLTSVLEPLAILAVIALAVVSVAGFWLSVKSWPRRS